MKVVISKKVIKRLKKSDDFVKSNFVRSFERLKRWFPFEKERNVHKLKWEYGIYWSINITWDYRIIFRIIDNTVFIDNFGTHSELYW